MLIVLRDIRQVASQQRGGDFHPTFMSTTTILLTISIALLAILDLSYALLGMGSWKEVRGKYGFRTNPGKRLTVARGGCLACIISLGIALVIAREELVRKEADR